MRSIPDQGYTLIEIIVVIVIIAILAAIAVPRYIDQSNAARQNSTNSVAAALANASAANFAARTANSSSGSAISNCNQIGGLLPNGLPAGYSITALAISAGSAATCTVSGPGSTSATFRGLGIA